MARNSQSRSTRPKPEAARSNTLPLVGAALGGLAAAALLFFNRRSNVLAASGHEAPDLEGDRHPGPDDRADPHFRPDMDAPMSAADREALAPPVGRPTLVDG